MNMIIELDGTQQFIFTIQLPHDGTKQQLLQIYDDFVTWDGNLISKRERDFLVDIGFVRRYNGWNFVTRRGLVFIYLKGWK